MKTIAKYMLALALLAAAVSCENPWYSPEEETGAEEVEVTFSVVFPEPVEIPTKAQMGEGHLLDDPFNIYLCLYGSGDGYVQHWIPTELISVTPDADNRYMVGGTFKTYLPVTDERRTVHVIANPPTDILPITAEYMDDVMKKMVTKDGECAYWQEISLPNGIHYQSGMTPTQDVVTAFTNIHLVRNFAKVIVTSAVQGDTDYQGFEVKRWTLINVPDMAYVAPYTGNQNNRFPSGYINVKNLLSGNQLYNQLTGTDNYLGSIPDNALINTAFPGNPNSSTYSSKYANRGGALYMYERPLPTTDRKQTALLVEITFDAQHNPDNSGQEGTYWYKIELLNQSGQYVPIFRDIVYRLKIQGLNEVGEATAQAAYNGVYFGNISASLETASLNELSDGTSLIHVDKMDYTFLDNNNGQPLTLLKPNSTQAAQFYFVPNTTTGTKYTHSEAGICDIQVTQESVAGFAPAVTAFSFTSDGAISVTLDEVGAAIKKSIIRVSGRIGDNSATNSHKYIYRDITINLMQKQDLKHGSNATSIISTPSGISGTGKPVNFRVWLPEGLGSSVFPIQLRIEAQKNTLTAESEDLPVSTGVSAFDSSKNTFFFIYTINYSDYCSYDPINRRYNYQYSFDFTLYTSKTGNNNASAIDIRDLGGDFNPTRLNLQ